MQANTVDHSAGRTNESGSDRVLNGRVDVAVLDAEGPPGVAFIRSLGARGVPVDVYGVNRRAPGRFSRYSRSTHLCPSPHDTDEFVNWLATELAAGRIAHVAPTSDYIAFAVAAAHERVRGSAPGSSELMRRTWGCLHKGLFGELMETAGFPTVPYRLPTSLDEALAAADELSYPVLLKPRSHVGIGFHRGAVVRDAEELAREFRQLGSVDGHDVAAVLDPDLLWPLMQQFVSSPSADVVSISGCVENGQVTTVGHCRKLAQWPPGVGIGSLFEAVAPSAFTEQALAAAAATAPPGPFELEVFVDHATGQAWPIDLNPRGFGQIALEVARGNDLPGAWYRSATGIELRPMPVRRPGTEVWQSGLTYYPGAAASLVRGADRGQRLRNEWKLLRRQRVGSVFDWRDPMPAVAMAAHLLQHPGSLVRPFLAADLA